MQSSQIRCYSTLAAFSYLVSSSSLLTSLACQSKRTVETVKGNRITHATQNMKTTRRWKRVDWGHVITHQMNLSMWQNRTITQLSMYAAITPLIHHSTRANVVSHNRTLYQHTIREWVALTCLSSYQHHTCHQLEVKVVLAIIY